MKDIKVVFKLDDFRGVTKNILKLDRIVRVENVKITWGIMGLYFSQLDDANIEWAKRSLGTGLYSYWNHGYTHAKDEFKRLNLAEQIDHLKRTQEIIKNKLGITSLTFGAPCNAINKETVSAVESIEEIKYWFYGDEDYSKILLKAKYSIEFSLGRPNYEQFKASLKYFEGGMLVLQAHPNMWKENDFLEFMKIISFLKENTCTFCFPEDL